MSIAPALRALDIDLPACPQTLVRLSLLMADEDANGLAMGRAARALDIEPWLAHAAGLFAASGQAALSVHDSAGYPKLCATVPDAADPGAWSGETFMVKRLLGLGAIVDAALLHEAAAAAVARLGAD